MKANLEQAVNDKLHARYNDTVHAVLDGDRIVLEGSLYNWDDIVAAGTTAVKALRWSGLWNKYLPWLALPSKEERGDHGAPRGGRKEPLPRVVNRITLEGAVIPPMRVPDLKDAALEGQRPDVLIIGGGITGAAILRELARYKLDALLIEKEHDLAMHASSRNDGMVHPGIDLRKGSKKYHYNMRGNAMYGCITSELGVPFKRNGQYLCFSNPLVIPVLYLSLMYWKWQRIKGVRVVLKGELHKSEPALKKNIHAALFFPSAGVVCPYGLTIACAENAVENGGRVSLDTAALSMEIDAGKIIRVDTNRGALYPKVVINAAGIFASEIAAMAKDEFYSIHPRRGTAVILDKKLSDLLVKTIASKLGRDFRTAKTKGGGVVRTVHGNILIGPDAVETWERENFATSPESIEKIINKFVKTTPALDQTQIIAYFSGVRAATYEEDFVVEKGRRTVNMIHVAGIQSPGLTSAPAIAEDAAKFTLETLEAFGIKIKKNTGFNPIRKPIPRPADMNDEERAALIGENPDYGIILCRCEEVSRGEILESLRRVIPCDTIDGVRRRVRSGSGRCQGGFCGPQVLRIIAEEKNIPAEKVCKSGPGGYVLYGPAKKNLPPIDARKKTRKSGAL
jgi:glycerol-3-phosphate dehydrogenase